MLINLTNIFNPNYSLVNNVLNWEGRGYFEPCLCVTLLKGQKYILLIETLGICHD